MMLIYDFHVEASNLEGELESWGMEGNLEARVWVILF